MHTREQKITRMEWLVGYLNMHQHLYDAGIPRISDKEWDELYFELQELEKELNIKSPNSPTQKINYTIISELKKVKHEYQPMLSLDKTKDLEKVKQFLGNKDWIAMLKLDGLTCRLTYENGKLVRAETRGDGIEGEDITHNARVLPSVPQRIDYKDTLVVDGEVICDKITFEKFKDEYANCRNFAAGSIRLLDSKECAKRGLTFVAWDVIGEMKVTPKPTLLTNKLSQLEYLNFHVVPFCCSHDLHVSLEECFEIMQEPTDYPIDGIVFKWDNIKEYEAAGRTDHHFRGGLAYKFYDEEYGTTLRDIEWTMGRTGVLTPVAIYEDTEIDGAICNRANLHNLNIMWQLLGDAPQEGQKLWIYKANQIIPQVSRAEIPKKSNLSHLLTYPTFCPYCGSPTEVKESSSGTIELYCSNDNCDSKLVNKLDHFVGKKGLDVKGLSKATLAKLIEYGWLDTIVDIFLLKAHEREWISKAGFGEKSVRKILDAIETARCTELSSFIAALGIPLIGKTVARDICKNIDSWEEFLDLARSDFDFTDWEGFGPEKNDRIHQFDYTYADYLVQQGYITFISSESIPAGNKLSGLVFCITGRLKVVGNRSDLKAKIEACGGKVTDSVSSKTNYLINNDINSTSAKNKKAKELNIPIITEQNLLEMIGE